MSRLLNIIANELLVLVAAPTYIVYRSPVQPTTMLRLSKFKTVVRCLLLLVVSSSFCFWRRADSRRLHGLHSLHAPGPEQEIAWQFERSHAANLSIMQIRAVKVTLMKRRDTKHFGSMRLDLVVLGQDIPDKRVKALSVIALAIVKDVSSWGSHRGFIDFLDLLTNVTCQTPDIDLSIGLLVSDKTYALDLG